MKIVTPDYQILHMSELVIPEIAGRTCYKSESKGASDAFIAARIREGHETIIEHGSMSVRFIADRGFTHELVRHRLAVYSQESTRWCNYKASGIELIHPPGLSPDQQKRRETFFWECQNLYDQEISEGLKPEIARGVLPHALKTEIVMTANYREWRLIFKQRALGRTGRPHPQMLQLMLPLLVSVQDILPAVFGDL